jgi:hypothetical protein
VVLKRLVLLNSTFKLKEENRGKENLFIEDITKMGDL